MGGRRIGQNCQSTWDHQRGLIIDTIRARNIGYSINKRPILTQKTPLTINRNDLVCISGPSGGGKTTLLNILSGLCKSSGEVLWGDININNPPGRQSIDQLRMDWISMIFQEPRLAKSLSGWENIYLPLKISNRFDTLDKPLLEQLLNTFFLSEGQPFDELDKQLHRKVNTFSSGQMQRIAIIRAIMTLPKYIFADEILNSVEPELQDKTWSAIKQICRDRRIGFLLVTHNQTLLKDPDFSQRITIANGAIT